MVSVGKVPGRVKGAYTEAVLSLISNEGDDPSSSSKDGDNPSSFIFLFGTA